MIVFILCLILDQSASNLAWNTTREAGFASLSSLQFWRNLSFYKDMLRFFFFFQPGFHHPSGWSKRYPHFPFFSSYSFSISQTPERQLEKSASFHESCNSYNANASGTWDFLLSSALALWKAFHLQTTQHGWAEWRSLSSQLTWPANHCSSCLTPESHHHRHACFFVFLEQQDRNFIELFPKPDGISTTC